MTDTIKHHLVFLYGEAAAPELERTIDSLTGRSRANHAPEVSSRASELTSADCMLITYGDQVRATGQPPLRPLTEFLSTRATSVLSAVHLLPFYPSSSDDGFSVMD